MKKSFIVVLVLVVVTSGLLFAEFKYKKGDVISRHTQYAQLKMTYMGKKQTLDVPIHIQRVVSIAPSYELYARDSRGISAGDYETWQEKYTYELGLDDWNLGYFTLHEISSRKTSKIYRAKQPKQISQPDKWQRLELNRSE